MLAIVDPESDEYQICEIEVKKMYIAVERRVSALLQEELRQVPSFLSYHLQDTEYMSYLFEGYSRENVFQPPQNTSITRASGHCHSNGSYLDVCFSITGWLKKHVEIIKFALDGGNYIQYISFNLIG